MNTTDNQSDKHPSGEDRIVEISREPVELFKVLKFEGMVGSGGEGKLVVAAGHVQVNGHVEMQKRKKIFSGDTIEFNGEKLVIRLVLPEVDETHSSAVPTEQDHK